MKIKPKRRTIQISLLIAAVLIVLCSLLFLENFFSHSVSVGGKTSSSSLSTETVPSQLSNPAQYSSASTTSSAVSIFYPSSVLASKSSSIVSAASKSVSTPASISASASASATEQVKRILQASYVPFGFPPPQGKKYAYLTFDDGPSQYTEKLIGILKKNQVHATFFVAFMKDTPVKRAIIKDAFDNGNVIGVHSYTHDYAYIYSGEGNFLDDFNRMKDIITEVTGVVPNVCRFPGGTGNTVSITASHGKIIMPTLFEDVEKMGIKPFDWNVGGIDAVTHPPSKARIAARILAECKNNNNVVILLHDTHLNSVDAVQDIINGLKEQGYEFKTLNPDAETVQEHFAGVVY